VVKTPFAAADLETGRGFAMVVGGRSILRDCQLKALKQAIELILRGFVNLALAGMFVRHFCGVVDRGVVL
jgi:hypothetical protein